VAEEQIKIRLSTEGAQQTRQDLDEVAGKTKELGDRTEQSASLAGNLRERAG